MTRTDDYDYDDILRDGESLRVSMMLMDGVQRAVARSHVTDHFAAHKPGFRYPQSAPTRDAAGADADPRQAAYADLGRRLTDGWRQLLGPRQRPSPHSTRSRLTKEADKEETASPAEIRDAAYEERLRYLEGAYRQPFCDEKLMQAGYHPAIAIGYGTGRDLRGPQAEAGIPDSERAYQESKIAASSAWRIPYSPTGIPTRAYAPMHERLDPQPGAHTDREVAEAKARYDKGIAEARDLKERRVGVAREDYLRRTGEAWQQGSARFRQSPKNATAIEKQAEGWRGGA